MSLANVREVLALRCCDSRAVAEGYQHWYDTKNRTFHHAKILIDGGEVLSDNLRMANRILPVFVTPKGFT
jgi:hypothetical protein